MKKLILSIVLAAMTAATPAMAGERHRDRSSSGKWVAPLIGGIVVGALIADSKNRERDRYRYTYQDGYSDPYSAYPDYERNRYRSYEIIERGPGNHYCVTRNYVDRYGYPTLTKYCQ